MSYIKRTEVLSVEIIRFLSRFNPAIVNHTSGIAGVNNRFVNWRSYLRMPNDGSAQI